jgi:hypothetical protein
VTTKPARANQSIRGNPNPADPARYFDNKRDIVDHVIDDLVKQIIAGLSADNAPDAVSTLEDYRAQSVRIAEALTGSSTSSRWPPR